MSAWRKKQQDLADALGWSDTRAATVDGLRVDLEWSSGERDYVLRVVARLSHPMDLGLRVHLAGSGESSAYPQGDAAFDGIFAVHVADGDAASVATLLDAEERATLRALAVAGYPRLDDFAFEMQLNANGRTIPELRRAVIDSLASARRIAARAESLPVPVELRVRSVAEALTPLATRMGLSVRRNQFTVSGDSGSAHIEARWRTQKGYANVLGALPAMGDVGLWLRARFHEPMEAGLHLERAGAFDRAKELVGLGDIHTGDAAFDRAWTIRARDPDLARAALGEGARAHIDRLAQLRARPTLTDAGIELSGPIPCDGEEACEVLRIVDELRERLRPRSTSGPYR